MKKIIVWSVIFLGACLYRPADAQVRVNINIGSQPAWGPVGYDYAQYYYLPDIDAYYYIPDRRFIYLDAGRWVFAASLPSRWGDYDLYRGYKVVINDPRPYLRDDYYSREYGRYRGYYGRQVVLRDRDGRYGRDDYHSDRGNHYGWYKHGRGEENDQGYRRGDEGGRGNWQDNGRGHGNGRGNDNGRGHGHGHGNGDEQ